LLQEYVVDVVMPLSCVVSPPTPMSCPSSAH